MYRFWIEDTFIDEIARHLSIAAQSIYICLKRHANGQRQAKIGSGRISKELGISVGTTLKGLKELRGKELISNRIGLHHSGHYEIYSLPQNLHKSPRQNTTQTPIKNTEALNQNLSIKESGINIKEEIDYTKTIIRTPEEQERNDHCRKQLKKRLIEKGIIKIR
jgi:hypothetical protein